MEWLESKFRTRGDKTCSSNQDIADNQRENMDIHFFNDEDTIDEEKYLLTCKRSLFYQWALEERKNISKDMFEKRKESKRKFVLFTELSKLPFEQYDRLDSAVV